VTSDPVHIFGFLAYFYFILTLFVSPLWYIFSKYSYLRKYSTRLIAIRRQLWIFTALSALLLLSLELRGMYLGWIVYLFGLELWVYYSCFFSFWLRIIILKIFLEQKTGRGYKAWYILSFL